MRGNWLKTAVDMPKVRTFAASVAPRVCDMKRALPLKSTSNHAEKYRASKTMPKEAHDESAREIDTDKNGSVNKRMTMHADSAVMDEERFFA